MNNCALEALFTVVTRTTLATKIVGFGARQGQAKTSAKQSIHDYQKLKRRYPWIMI
jgi:hypothetical protein